MSSPEPESNYYNYLYESLSQKIISEIKKRPALYDTTIRQYRDKKVKAKLWNEVYASIDSNWDKLSVDEKKSKSRLIQKKWKNMRDSFAKELAMHQSSQGVIKKKKYIHFDSMLFLVPCLQNREPKTKIASPSQSDSNDQTNFLQNEDSQPASSSKKSSQSTSNDDNCSYEQTLLNILNAKQSICEYDEDINFSQMIVPMLRKLNDEQKHYAKIEIMNILHKAKSYHHYHVDSPVNSQGSFMSFTQTPSSQSSHQTHFSSMSPNVEVPLPVPIKQETFEHPSSNAE